MSLILQLHTELCVHLYCHPRELILYPYYRKVLGDLLVQLVPLVLQVQMANLGREKLQLQQWQVLGLVYQMHSINIRIRHYYFEQE